MPVSAPENLRGTPALRQVHRRNHVVIVCHDDPGLYEAAAGELASLNATLVVEREAGPLSARLGRPSVTVCDRYLDVGLYSESPPVSSILETVRGFDMRCEECPQAADEIGSPWLAARRIHT